MKDMSKRLPGFTAVASLYRKSECYNGAGVYPRLQGGVSLKSNGVILAARISCVCDDEGCCCAPVGRRCRYHKF